MTYLLGSVIDRSMDWAFIGDLGYQFMSPVCLFFVCSCCFLFYYFSVNICVQFKNNTFCVWYIMWFSTQVCLPSILLTNLRSVLFTTSCFFFLIRRKYDRYTFSSKFDWWDYGKLARGRSSRALIYSSNSILFDRKQQCHIVNLLFSFTKSPLYTKCWGMRFFMMTCSSSRNGWNFINAAI